MGSKNPDDDIVGTPHGAEPGKQTAAQKAILGGGGEEGGQPEPKSTADWAARGASGGTPGRAPVALGGSSQGQADRKPAGGTVSDVEATNPKTKPGVRHEA